MPETPSPLLADVALLVRSGFPASAICDTLARPMEEIEDLTTTLRKAQVPLPLQAREPHTDATVAWGKTLVHELSLHPDRVAIPHIAPAALLTAEEVMTRYGIERETVQEATIQGDLPIVHVNAPDTMVRYWIHDIEHWLTKRGHPFTRARPIIGKAGLVLALAREGFTPAVIQKALGWEHGARRISVILTNLRKSGVSLAAFPAKRELLATDIERCQERAAEIRPLLPIEYYPPTPIVLKHPGVTQVMTEIPAHDPLDTSEERIRALWNFLVEGYTWTMIQPHIRLTRQGFDLRRKRLGLPPASEVRRQRNAAQRRARTLNPGAPQ